MDYLPLIVPLFGAFALQTCVFGCLFARTNRRAQQLEQRITDLNNEIYRMSTRVQRTPPFQPVAPPPPLPLPPPPPLMLAPRPMYYYPAPQPSAPPAMRPSIVEMGDPQSPLRV
jgi:hypothetical protein